MNLILHAKVDDLTTIYTIVEFVDHTGTARS